MWLDLTYTCTSIHDVLFQPSIPDQLDIWIQALLKITLSYELFLLGPWSLDQSDLIQWRERVNDINTTEIIRTYRNWRLGGPTAAIWWERDLVLVVLYGIRWIGHDWFDRVWAVGIDTTVWVFAFEQRLMEPAWGFCGDVAGFVVLMTVAILGEVRDDDTRGLC